MLWRPTEHEPLTETAWDESLARAAIDRIVADAEGAVRDGFWPGHPLDELEPDERFCSLYLGSAGMVWALHRLGSSLDCGAVLSRALEHYRTAPDLGRDAHPPSLWMGETGVLVVAEVVGSPDADRERLRALIRENRVHPTWELMWGSPGTMLAARACGLADEYEDSARLLLDAWDDATGLWTQHLYGKVRRYLGPAHGFAGNVHSLRAHLDADALRARVTAPLERTAGREDGVVNWPPEDRTLDELAAEVRVQWCHGAPGMIATLGDLMPRELALGGGELTWRAGPLRKGPGLCHGTAGNGFALLRLHELTGEAIWLERARRFAMHAIEQVRRDRARVGHGRYTLWTGDAGVALYLDACLEASAWLPTIDGF